ncbi:MAG TPA: DUF927 domain-containing protein [Thiomonas arsenitoxydans]|uniref:DUF927 domain-containing protein n=1 Tax=Thiomonas TaxID=32012 RepID=UPI00257E727C|nr:MULTISPECIES: DUF927 domain-containing protein [Thiomonas]HML80169.1 DUF927 domain-containing protein [Thiomonas arsenitoxydans]
MSDLALEIEDFSEVATETGVAKVSGVQANSGAVSSETPAETRGVAEVANTGYPADSERPCWRVLDDWQEVEGRKLRPGVWRFGMTAPKKDSLPQPVDTWVSSPVHITAVTADTHGGNFGRLLRFKTTLGNWRTWAMPQAMLRGSGDDLRGELLSMGVEISPRNRATFGDYLQQPAPKKRVTCALEVGWAGKVFVLPDATIGPGAASVIFQSGEGGTAEYATGGTLKAWISDVASPARNNPMLMLALSVAFTGPLLAKCNAEGGGVHLVGDSSTGKTTAAEAARSVWGPDRYKRTWKATANGLEGAGTLFNDNLLVLDEISEADPRDVGMIAYMLGNGTGKQRASRTGSARPVTRWRCIVLSTGERTLATSMLEAGQRAKSGQAVRLLDVPVQRQHGAWDDLHGLPDGRAFSDAIKTAASQHYGHAGRQFLERLTRDPQDFGAALDGFKSLPEFSPDGGEGQDKRAAARFAMIAMAGELATEYGLTGWGEGEATQAAAIAFTLWRSARGHGNGERRQIIEQLAAFVSRHGDARFSDVAASHDIAVRDRAGWWKDEGNGRSYLFTADGMREALKGFDFKAALDSLEAQSVIPAAGADGKRTRFHRINGRPLRLYPVDGSKLEG